ncbi:MAG: response regulator transcription factor [Sphingobacterium sp.]|jgi:DNA-binding NarL/FixJ family response regulator|uniref:response regulator transcription factor n=1 Tax=Sphingobacterium sp. TaxID=341027 RepID=UPI002839A376|nr:response regulator transcription factor [Sphingobacterium sp.]MDR0265446.1 response regulator transcription factor [Sphingobacterium sp.]
MIKILLVDDHEVVRNGISLLLESNPSFYIIGEVGSAEDALLFIEQQDKPDLILSDINMSGMDGISLVRIVKKIYPQIKIAVLSMIDEIDKVAEAFDAGAEGYLSKSNDFQELLFGIAHIAGGNKYISAFLSVHILEVYRNFVPEPVDKAALLHHYDITERELEVLVLISEGFTNGEIADRIFLSKRTVEGHRQHLMEKTKTKNTADLVRFGFQKMLLQ